jgi:hypothetical protein
MDELSDRVKGRWGFRITGITDLLDHVVVHTVEIPCSGVYANIKTGGTPGKDGRRQTTKIPRSQ